MDDGFTADGRRKQRRVSSRSQSVARDKLDTLKTEIKIHGSPLGNQTVAEWGAFWLETICKPKLKPQPYRTYRAILATWVIPAIGKKKVKEVRPSDLQRIYAKIKTAGHTATASKTHTVLSSMFESARLEKLVGDNVAKSVRAPKPLKKARDTLAPEETMRILNAANTSAGTKWLVSLYAGIRQGERLGATIDSVDFGTGLFTVLWGLSEANYEHGCDGTCSAKAAGHCPKKQLVTPDDMEYRVLKGRLMLLPPKSGESRTFPLPVSLLALLRSQILELDNQPNPHGLLWPAKDGSPITSGVDQAEWKALLIQAGVDRPTATTHWARHTAISDLTASGVPERVIGEIVGHKSPGVTGRYQHVSSRDAADAMGKLEERRQIEG
ncbi:tyrosine-type recombinase/integrase [Subtercola vilae]|uniref:tyrosine-type recombinase/integrase n=1 Tax=Subtercola vilae TaxID=2056433 RepID=UPI00137610BE|nr:site-specific integrase [Subtercola vilae]